jgi:hypothetical protein
MQPLRERPYSLRAPQSFNFVRVLEDTHRMAQELFGVCNGTLLRIAAELSEPLCHERGEAE